MEWALQRGGGVIGLAAPPARGVLDKKVLLGYRQSGDSAYDQE